MNPHKERKAEACILGAAVIEGGFPIIINQAVRVFPALAFAGISAAVGSLMHLILLLLRRVPFPKAPKKIWMYLVGIALCNSVFALLFIFLGTRYTSGINTALLMQSEMLFSFLIFTLIFGEKALPKQYLGAAGVFFGTIIVLYNGSFTLNRGDLLIILGTAFYPFGNQLAKTVLPHFPSSFILMVRHLAGAVSFILLSVLFEDLSMQIFSIAREYWWLIALYGIVVLVGSKLLWYTGLRVLTATKAVSIVLAYPVFSLVFAAIFLGEIPTVYQLLGFGVTLTGLSVLVSRPSPPSLW